MSIFTKATLSQTHVIREGVAIVRSLIKAHDFGQGISTTELYRLASEVPAPKGFTGDPRLGEGPGRIKGTPSPPNNDHPIRSKAFLKKTILPALEGSGELKKVCTTKEITAPILKIKKGKVTKKPTTLSASASPENPIKVNAWVWTVPTDAEKSAHDIRQEKNSLHLRPPVQKEDISHLNKRRQRSRESEEL